MRRNRLLRWLVEPEPPGLGIDLRSTELSLARLAVKSKSPEVDLCVTEPLPPGLMKFEMLEPNVLDEEGFRQLLSSTLLRTGTAERKRVALSLPDYVARISVSEIPAAPRSQGELTEFLKFRMKKSLPFDVEHARVAFERLPGPVPTFLTGVMHEAVVSQYERVLEGLGLRVGLVLPASVSLLQLLRPVARNDLAPGADCFFVNVEREYFSVSLVRERETPTLIRTLGLRANGEGSIVYGEEDLLREIIPTAIYYREKLSGRSLERVYYRSLRPDLLHLREILEDQFEAPTEPFQWTKVVGTAKDVRLDAPQADAVGAAAGAARGKVA